MNDTATAQSNRVLGRVAVGLLLLFILTVGALAYRLLTSKVLPQTCSSFDSYNQAVRAFKAGNTALDGDHDGIPCEALLHGEKPPAYGT